MHMPKLSQVFLLSALACLACIPSAAQAQTGVRSEVTSIVPSRVIERVDETRVVTLTGNTHTMARPEFDKGLVEASLPMERMVLVLKRSPEQEAALTAFNERQQDPSSPDYHHWIHAEEFGRTYGPSDADMATVTNWLERSGFQIYNVSKGRVTIEFSGTAAQVQNAFHVEMHHYLVDNVMHIANDRNPQIPEALAPVIVGVSSLHNFFPKAQVVLGRNVFRDSKTGRITAMESDPARALTTPATAAKGNLKPQPAGTKATPQLTYTDSSGDIHEDVTPFDIATIYNILPTWNAGTIGTGVKIALAADSDVNVSDFNTFRSTFGLPASTLQTVHNGTDPGVVSGDASLENTLDVEMSGATAPGAQIVLVVSADTNTTGGFQLSDQYIADNETAPIMSASYGSCELNLGTSGNATFNKIWQQASTEGISVFESSGDQGSAGCTRSGTPPTGDAIGLQVNGMASSPYVTAVGGTDFTWSFINSPATTYWNATANAQGATAKGYLPEVPWNSTCASTLLPALFNEPSNEQLCNDALNSTNYVGLVNTGAGSGGVSHCTTPTGTTNTTCAGGYAKPSWQTGYGVPADGKRDVPDVSLFSSGGFPDGLNGSALLFCDSAGGSCTYTASGIGAQEVGGTSASSPMMAGIMALIVQKTGSAQGLANPEFYSLYAKQIAAGTACDSSTVTNGNACIFYDVSQGTISQVCITGDLNCVTNTSGDQAGLLSGYATTKGYDAAVGLGTLNVTNLVNAWPTTATTATLSFTPSSLTFPSTAIGTTTAAQSVTVKNTGTGAVTFNTIGLTGSNDFAITGTTCPSPLAAGASCTVSIDFDPVAAGTVTGTISFADSATGSPQTVGLSGTGASTGGTGLTITPSSLSFASTTVGSSAATQTITLKNSTSAAVSFTASTTITGSGASSFAKTASTCTNPLAAGASCTNTITFTPTTTGTLTATVTYTDSASSTPQTVALSGTGASASAGLTITPTSLTFASTTVGTSAATQTITLKNGTSSAVSFTASTTITGSGASSFAKTASTCTNPLAAGASCTNTITFTPTTSGALSATVTYTDSASSTPQTVSLFGTGASASTGLTITPSSLTFASTAVGSSAATQTITLKNGTSAAVSFTASTTITGSGASSFAKTASTCTNPLAAGASCTNTINFTPTTAGTLTATVTYTDSASSTPQTVALSGTGAAAGLTITPSSLTFASTAVGTSAATQVITLKNNTTAAVTFTASTTITGAGASSFTKSASTCTNPLAVGASCTNTITFTPKATGTLSATVTYTDSATSAPQTVSLFGTGH